jgi:hypothetical protein
MAAVVVLAVLGPRSVHAQAPACVQEAEPNDAPEAVAPLVAPGCVGGTLPAGDQDIWTWDVSEADAARPSTIILAGPVASLTSLSLVPITSDPGVTPVEVGGPILELSHTPADIDPVTRPDVLLPAGRYLVGLARATAPDSVEPLDTAYSVTIEPGTPLPAPGEREPNDDADHATPLADAFALSADMSTSGDVYRWRIGADDASRAWSLDLASGLGVVAGLTLAGKDGTMLVSTTTDRAGRISIPDLQLPRGEYLLSVSYPTEQPQVYTLRATAAPLGAADPEPNGDPATAIAFDTSAGVTGRLGHAGDVDV